MVVVGAVDREDASRVAQEAHELAESFDDDLHLLHVLSQREFVDLETTSVNDTGQPIEMDRVREVAADIAAENAADAGIDSFTAVGKVGDPSDTIVEYADEVDARYIVVGGRERSPAGKAIFGSVTQSVLLNTDRPVLVVMTQS
jgi:nucleotide-binding universal stress UspA family protein